MDGVSAADIEAVNGVGKADIQAINGLTVPAAGATRWVVAMDDAYIAHATNSDRTSWTLYDHVVDTGTPRALDIAFGKDGSGNGIYICSRSSSSKEILISGTDVTTVADWTVENFASSNKIYSVAWGADTGASVDGTWIAAGNQSAELINRSVDGGQNWVTTDLSGLTGHVSNQGIQGVASNGAGTWAFGQGDRFYISTDDAQSFAVSTPWAGNDPPVYIRGIAYTNSSWVIVYTRESEVRYRSCAASDIADWGDEETPDEDMRVPSGTAEDRVCIAAANGRVCLVSTADRYVAYFDVNGKTISNAGSIDINGMEAEDIATDGPTWLIASRGGDIWESTNNGEAWSEIATDIGTGTSEGDAAQGITCDVVLPL
jgi:hypothetical protein